MHTSGSLSFTAKEGFDQELAAEEARADRLLAEKDQADATLQEIAQINADLHKALDAAEAKTRKIIQRLQDQSAES